MRFEEVFFRGVRSEECGVRLLWWRRKVTSSPPELGGEPVRAGWSEEAL